MPISNLLGLRPPMPIHGEPNEMTNTEKILNAIRKHPEGIDDDELSEITRVEPRQQIHQICSRLAVAGRIRRESIEKPGKRRKIHNFPVASSQSPAPRLPPTPVALDWQRTLNALVAATGRTEDDLMREALQDLGMKVLKERTS